MDATLTQMGIDDIGRLASSRIIRRGLAYARAGRVKETALGENRVEGVVQGSADEPYVVWVEHDGEELLAECTCPFDWEPFCKHAIALLAASLGREPGDRSFVMSEERRVRRKRGAKEGFRIRRVEGRSLLGTYRVDSPSGKSYTVEIRSLAGRINRCTCPDFDTSMLGTCKHVEAVLHALEKRAPRKFRRLAARPPDTAMVLVEQGETPRIRLVLPARPSPRVASLAAEYFDMEGYFARDPVDGFSAFLAQARRLRSLVVCGDALEHSGRLADERRAAARKEEIERAVLAAGNRIPGLRARLYPFQVEGAAFLASRGRALLGDDMGLGKTVQAIAAAQVLRERGEVRRALVVCPASLKHQWKNEIARFTGHEAVVVGGSKAERLELYGRREPFTVVNYEMVLRDGRAIGAMEPDLLVVDEAQRVRNWRTKTAQAIKSIPAPHAFVLTGTPLQNRLDDLFSLMQVVDRRVLGPLWSYNETYVVRDPARGRVTGYANISELRRRLAPVLTRREKDQVRLQLPERVDSRIGVELTPAQREIMDEAIANMARLAKIAERRPLTPEEEQRLFAFMQRARMSCNAAGLVDKRTEGSPKLEELSELVRELCVESDRKVVVFSEWEKFQRKAARVAERLGVGHVRFHGGVPTAKRGSLIEKFRDDPDTRIFFSTDAGGVGLNLQFADTLVNLELPWNPSVLEQRIGRLHRHGQRRSVHVIMLVSEDSYEAGIERVLAGKREIFSAALSPGDGRDAVAAPSSCLAFVRETLPMRPGAEPLIEEEPPEPAAEPRAEEAGRDDPLRRLIDMLGTRVARAVALPSGRILAQVDRLDEASREAARLAGVSVADWAAFEALEGLGADSPLEGASVVMDRPAPEADGADPERAEHLSVAARKLRAARSLAGEGLGAEAMGLAHACMRASLRALAAGSVETALAPARLLYEVLIPSGRLSLEQASLVSRADGLSRSYEDAGTPVPGAMLEAVVADAESLLEHARAAS